MLFNRLLKEEKGMAVAMALMIMMILALLGSALWYYSINDTIQVNRDQMRTQAHYLARSGADALGQYIAFNPDNRDIDALVKVLSKAGPSDQIVLETDYLGNAGTLELEVIEVSRTVGSSAIQSIEVTGTGYIGDVAQQVTLVLEKLKAGDIFDAAIMSNNNLDLSGMKLVNGDLVSKGSIAVPVTYDSTKYKIDPYAQFTMPLKKFPPRSTTYTDNLINVGNGQTRLINSNRVIDEIRVASNGLLVIESGVSDKLVVEINKFDARGPIRIKTQPGRDIILIINDMIELSGSFTIEKGAGGAGNVYLFVRNAANFKTPQFTVDPDNVFIVYLEEGSNLNLHANFIFEGHIYGPQATVKIQTAGCTIRGSAVVNHFIGLNANIIYKAPVREDEIEMGIGYKVSLWRQ